MNPRSQQNKSFATHERDRTLKLIREVCVFKLTEFSPSNRSPTHPLEILKVFSVKNAVKWFFTANFQSFRSCHLNQTESNALQRSTSSNVQKNSILNTLESCTIVLNFIWKVNLMTLKTLGTEKAGFSQLLTVFFGFHPPTPQISIV